MGGNLALYTTGQCPSAGSGPLVATPFRFDRMVFTPEDFHLPPAPASPSPEPPSTARVGRSLAAAVKVDVNDGGRRNQNETG